MKRRTALPTITLLIVLLLLAILRSAAPPAAAYGYDYGWGCASVIYSTQWLTFDSDEYQIHLACEQIYNLFSLSKVSASKYGGSGDDGSFT